MWQAMPEGDPMHQMVAEIRDKVTELDRWMRGDGVGGGIVGRVSRNEDRIQKVEDRLDEKDKAKRGKNGNGGDIRWKAIGQIAVALTAAVSLAMSYFGG